MKIRRAPSFVDLQDLPLEERDRALLARIHGETSLPDLVAGTAWDAADTARRIHRLLQLGLLERVKRIYDQSGVIQRTALPDDDAVTLKPAKPVPVAQLFREADAGAVEIRTPRGAVLVDGAVVRHERSIFTRATLVDADPSAHMDGLDEDTPLAGVRRTP